MPAGLEFTPFVEVRGDLAGVVKGGDRGHELVHHAESADVHSPERHTAHREVQSRGHLGAHVVPTGTDVAAPGGCGISLQTGEAASCEQEHPLVRIDSTLAVIDGVSVDKGVSVEIFSGRSEGGWGRQSLLVVHRQTVSQVRLAGVHPPGINLAAVL